MGFAVTVGDERGKTGGSLEVLQAISDIDGSGVQCRVCFLLDVLLS